jgi:hypothetical protein
MAESTQVETVEDVVTIPTTGDQSTSETESETPPTPIDWDSFLTGQSDEVKKLYDEHTKGLKSALVSEREESSDLKKKLREAAKGADEATAAKLNEIVAAQEKAEKRASFYESAASEGCNNLRLAWIAAQDLGDTDLKVLKDKFPELFHKERPAAPPKASAGAGTQTQPEGVSMDDLIRRASGRNV